MGRGKSKTKHFQNIPSLLEADLNKNRKQFKGEELWRRNYIAHRIFHLSKNYKKDLAKIRTKNNSQTIHDLLLFEYKEVLPQYENRDYDIKQIPVADIEPSNKNHYKQLPKERVQTYSNISSDIPRGIVKPVGLDRYRVVDGHHRLKASVGEDKILVFVLKS